MFFRCPGRLHDEDEAAYEFSCSIRDKLFIDVAPDAGETIGKLRFNTIFCLARLISIFESERNVDRKRFLMADPSYMFVTVSDVQKAFSFLKHCCDHVFRALSLRDGSLLMLPHDGGTGVPVHQLNELNNEGIRFAKQSS
ncbi:unnamed protein product [Heligmosomoides polygyrus]|uniref:IRS-type PTB domain-containing protein n=1 Tax=Heligmosomoides polygyrus TaxID=6339 RepID=A0A183FLZ5_HELPZ|nr:unnamed protein product [Heligmosomoides polygyrus]